MFKWINKIFNRFTIEYHPYAQKYYAKRNGRYLRRDWSTGIVEVVPFYISNPIVLAGDFRTKEKAVDIIKLYKEQQYGENVKIINA